MSSNRRSFIKRAALSAAAASVLPAASHAAETGMAAASGEAARPRDATPTATATTLDEVLTAAVGDAVLPESLGAAGRADATAAFLTWIADYRPVSEEMHGYGYAEIRYTPSDPAPGWNAQLAGLDLLARATQKRGFVALDVETRRALLTTQLSRVAGSRLPSNPLTAPHVAIALLAHWAASSAATDLAYGARVIAGNCRPLAETVRRPLPLAEGTAR